MGEKKMNSLAALAGKVVNLQDRKVKPTTTKTMNAAPSQKKARNYAVLPWRAIHDKEINKTAAYIVLSVMCGYTNRHGETWVSQQTVADILGVTRQAVQKQQRILVEKGYLEQLQRGNKHFSSKYRVIFDASQTIEEVKANTPPRLREDHLQVVPESDPVSREVAIERIGNLKSMLKGRTSTQPQKLPIDEGSKQPQKLRQDDSQSNLERSQSNLEGVSAQLPEVALREVEGYIEEKVWFEED